MIRVWARGAMIVAGLLVCVPLHFLWRLFRRPSLWPRRFLWWVGFCAGLRIRTEGAALRRDVLFVANHVSWLDIFALGGTTGAAFVAKAELKRSPAVRRIAALNDTLYVERENRRGMHGHASEIREAHAAGRAVALFPEATTGPGGDLLPFRPSLLSSLFPALPRVRVQPVAIDYGAAEREIAWIDESGAANVVRILSRPGTLEVTLRFLDPVDPHAAGDRKQLAALSRDEIVRALGASEAAANLLYAGR